MNASTRSSIAAAALGATSGRGSAIPRRRDVVPYDFFLDGGFEQRVQDADDAFADFG
ncbi:MAG: hypothetical protein U0599_29090 [Vicinamibacteria bacterium]